MAMELDIVRGQASKSPMVLASKSFKINQLFLVPLIRSVNAISFKGSHPWQLAVDVKEGAEPCITAYIQGSSTLPKLQQASVLADPTKSSRRSDHAWKDTDFPWPFWLVRRSMIQDECNCTIVSYTTRQVSTFSAPSDEGGSKPKCLIDTVEVSVPLLCNTKALAVGDELVVFWKKAEVASPRATKPPKIWQTAAVQEFKQFKKAARV